jgi:hypothetical protein
MIVNCNYKFVRNRRKETHQEEEKDVKWRLNKFSGMIGDFLCGGRRKKSSLIIIKFRGFVEEEKRISQWFLFCVAWLKLTERSSVL